MLPFVCWRAPAGVETYWRRVRPRQDDMTVHEKNPRDFAGFGDWRWLRGRDLNPRPLGYEPNELPDCSTPRHVSFTQCNTVPYTDQAFAANVTTLAARNRMENSCTLHEHLSRARKTRYANCEVDQHGFRDLRLGPHHVQHRSKHHRLATRRRTHAPPRPDDRPSSNRSRSPHPLTVCGTPV